MTIMLVSCIFLRDWNVVSGLGLFQPRFSWLPGCSNRNGYRQCGPRLHQNTLRTVELFPMFKLLELHSTLHYLPAVITSLSSPQMWLGWYFGELPPIVEWYRSALYSGIESFVFWNASCFFCHFLLMIVEFTLHRLSGAYLLAYLHEASGGHLAGAKALLVAPV